MTTNDAAARILEEAFNKLLMTYDSASKTDRSRIRFAANRLKEEWDKVKGRTAATKYSEITGGITAATGRLKRIAADRDQLANSMVSAAQSLDVVTKVLGLLSK